YHYVHTPDLHSFPTRRSSDLSCPWQSPHHRYSREWWRATVRFLPGLLVRVFDGKAHGSRLQEPATAASGLLGKKRTVALHHSRRSEEHTSELQSPYDLVCRPL